MCGIFCALSRTQHVLPSLELQNRLNSRGPDSSRVLQLSSSTGDVNITLCATVLCLRGSKTVTQPLQDDGCGFTLCWNGEAWRINDKPTPGNDTEAVHRLLVDALSAPSRGSIEPDTFSGLKHVADGLSRIAGPYAFIFLDHLRNTLFLGRDFLERRSLLYTTTATGDLIFSSVSDSTDSTEQWQELDANGVYAISLNRAVAEAMPSSVEQRTLGNYAALIAPYTSTSSLNGSLDLKPSVGPPTFYWNGHFAHIKVGHTASFSK